jgi:succinate dehydrogenase / fumarate reductase flavoprotein subunit/fumarate reductase flavoprotein subunit
MGGVVIDPNCFTSVPGLLVAGEDAGGTHGANRLGGNGVAESTVFGARAGESAAAAAEGRGLYMPEPELVAASVERAYAPLHRDGDRLPFALTDRLKAEMPRMLAEHNAIVEALKELGRAATVERHPEVSRFVDELRAHAQNEEQVLYPAAIVVGEYMKLKFRDR